MPCRSWPVVAAAPRLALAILVATSLVACDPKPVTTPSPLSSPTPDAAASPIAAVPTPTPSLSPADLGAAFVAAIADPAFRSSAAIDGTVTSGSTAGRISGNVTFDGRDSSSTMTLKLGVDSRAYESIRLGSDAWHRREPGPWLADEATSDRSRLTDLFASITAVNDLGVEVLNGQSLHHLRPANSRVTSAAALGFDDASIEDASFGVDFFVSGTGVPVTVSVSGGWTQPLDGTDVPVEIEMAYRLSAVGIGSTIRAPDDVWVMQVSKRFAYSMAHPPGWTVETSKTEDAYAIDGQPYVYVAPQTIAKGLALDDFVAALEAFYLDDFGKPISVDRGSLGGRPSVRLIYAFTNDQGQDVTFVDEVTVRGRTGWEVFLMTAGGAEDIPIFDRFVATFAFVG